MIYSDKIKSFEFKDPCLCNAWVAAAVIGAGASIWGANKAAETQKNATNQAAAIQQQQYQQTRRDLAPYRAIGEDASTRLSNISIPEVGIVITDQMDYFARLFIPMIFDFTILTI
jgi:hypothetical protein